MGGKDLYRQARAIWRQSLTGDARAKSGVAQLDAGTKTIHAAYKDLHRRDRFDADFRPTPYDVWSFRHDRAFGIPHPGSIPPALMAHTLHYYTSQGALVVNPMAGGGTTLDVCQSMGRRCLAYDLHPVRPEILAHDVRLGLPTDAADCDLIFCDPPYHTMLARHYSRDGIATAPLSEWIRFLNDLAKHSFATLRPGGYLALLLAPQTEKISPQDSDTSITLFGYAAATQAGFLPERRISCPMDGAYLPQHVRRARSEGRLLGQVRDLLVMRKPSQIRDCTPGTPDLMGNDSAKILQIRDKSSLTGCHSGTTPFWHRPPRTALSLRGRGFPDHADRLRRVKSSSHPITCSLIERTARISCSSGRSSEFARARLAEPPLYWSCRVGETHQLEPFDRWVSPTLQSSQQAYGTDFNGSARRRPIRRLGADGGVGEGGMRGTSGSGSCRIARSTTGRAGRAQLLDHVGHGGLFGGLFIHFTRLLLPGFQLPQLILELATAVFEPAGDLRQEVISILDARPM